MAFYPSIDELFAEASNKKIIMKVKRSYRSVLTFAVLFLVSLFISVLLILLFPPEARAGIPIIQHISMWWFLIVPTIFGLETLRKFHDDLYVFDRHRLTHLDGRLSLSYNIPVVKYTDVRAITVVQDIVGRVFDYGNVEIGTAAQQGAELTIVGIRRPAELAILLDKLRTRSRGTLKAEIEKQQISSEEADEFLSTNTNSIKDLIEELRS